MPTKKNGAHYKRNQRKRIVTAIIQFHSKLIKKNIVLRKFQNNYEIRALNVESWEK